MSEELQNQGLQTDGNPPEPSQNLEGKEPAPSQVDTDQLTDQSSDDLLSGQDDRGVSAENVLSEVLRKVNKLTEDFDNLKSTQSQQPQQFQQPYQQPNVQQQSQSRQIIPKSPDEIAEIVNREAQEKYGEAFKQGTVDYWELQKFQNKRFAELNSSMMNNVNVIQSERANSENRILGLYPDLNNPKSQLSQAVLTELNRRAALNRTDFNSYYRSNPYCLESITPIVASQFGIGAKIQNQPKIAPRQSNLPPNNFPGKQTQVENKVKPTQEDVLFGKRFGIKPESLVKVKKGSNPESLDFVDESDILLS